MITCLREYARVVPGSVAVMVMALAGCENAGSALDFGASQTGTIRVGLYLDRDGTKTASAFDTVLVRARVMLRPAVGDGVVQTVLSDEQGLVVFQRVPLGEYRVTIDPVSLGDSLIVGRIDSTKISIVPADTLGDIIARLEYPEVSIRAARGTPPGRRVFLRGILLSTLQSFRDTTVHLADTSGYLRLTRAGFLGSTPGNNAGDSVTVIATTGERTGQPVGDLARIARLLLRPPPVPIPVSSAVAATADVGRLDAALVLVTSSIISDSATVSPDFKVIVSDGTGDLEVLIDATIGVNRTVFQPGRSMNVRGVLVPNGAGGWRLKPRDFSDILIN